VMPSHTTFPPQVPNPASRYSSVGSPLSWSKLRARSTKQDAMTGIPDQRAKFYDGSRLLLGRLGIRLHGKRQSGSIPIQQHSQVCPFQADLPSFNRMGTAARAAAASNHAIWNTALTESPISAISAR
jgi:hypothetical protein